MGGARLRDGAIQLLRAMGYRSDLALDLGGVPDLLGLGSELTERQRQLFDSWSDACGLFQFTGDEMPRAVRWRSGLAEADQAQSILFLAVELTAWEASHRVVGAMTRAVNRIFAMPVVVMYRYCGPTDEASRFAVAVVHRRANKKDRSKDVLERGAVVVGERTDCPSDAFIELLAGLSLDRLTRIRRLRRVDEVHLAWERALRGFSALESLDPFLLYVRDLERYPLIGNVQREQRIARRAREGDRQAAGHLATANLRFVMSRARRFRGRGLGLPDLVCIGNEGLLKAVSKFDPDRGVKFISYAVWWIRQTIFQALAEQTRPVRIPLNQHANLVRLRQTQATFEDEHGRRPNALEIAEEMDEAFETVRVLRWASADVLHLDAPLDKSDLNRSSRGEWFSGEGDADIEEEFEDQARREFLERMFERYLTERERRILVLYFGLDDGDEMTLEQIGELLGVTRERIRQIRNRAFDKLRVSPDGEALEALWRGHG